MTSKMDLLQCVLFNSTKRLPKLKIKPQKLTGVTVKIITCFRVHAGNFLLPKKEKVKTIFNRFRTIRTIIMQSATFSLN